MDDADKINHLRNKLEAKLAEKGYEYSDVPYGRSGDVNPYKSVSETNTQGYMSGKQDIYAKYDEGQLDKPKMRVCPTCESPATYVCGCEKGEVMCNNRHTWWFRKNGSLVLGDPHEDETSDEETDT